MNHLPKNFTFFLSNQRSVRTTKVRVSAPSHVAVMVSSIPSHLESPTPATTPIAQMGQNANDFPGNNTSSVVGVRILRFILVFMNKQNISTIIDYVNPSPCNYN